MATGPGHMTTGRPGWQQGRLYGYSAQPHGTRVAVMAAGLGPMAPGRLGWQQGLATWHQGGWDGNVIWPPGTKLACRATVPSHIAPGVAWMATWPGHMATGRLGWQQGITIWHQGGWDGNTAWPHGTKKAG